MPIIKSAIKKVRKDKTRTLRNKKRKNDLRKILKDALKNPSQKLSASAYSALDKAAKVNLIHKNKAARLKSRVSKAIAATK